MSGTLPSQSDLLAIVPSGTTPASPVTANKRLLRPPGRRIVTERPAQLPPGAQWRSIDTRGQALEYLLMRSRRRTIGFLISDEGLKVTAPTWASQSQIDAAIEQKSSWILNKLLAWQNRCEQRALADAHWQNGGEFPYLGVALTLSLSSTSEKKTTKRHHYLGNPSQPKSGDRLQLALAADASSTQIRESAETWLQQQAARLFPARVQEMASRHGLRVRQLRLSSARTRWGSCTSDGRIMLNWRLIHFSSAIIDYVIAHELAHLREMNHGPDFWSEVSRIIPDYKAARDALRAYQPGDLPMPSPVSAPPFPAPPCSIRSG